MSPADDCIVDEPLGCRRSEGAFLSRVAEAVSVARSVIPIAAVSAVNEIFDRHSSTVTYAELAVLTS